MHTAYLSSLKLRCELQNTEKHGKNSISFFPSPARKSLYMHTRVFPCIILLVCLRAELIASFALHILGLENALHASRERAKDQNTAFVARFSTEASENMKPRVFMGRGRFTSSNTPSKAACVLADGTKRNSFSFCVVPSTMYDIRRRKYKNKIARAFIYQPTDRRKLLVPEKTIILALFWKAHSVITRLVPRLYLCKLILRDSK